MPSFDFYSLTIDKAGESSPTTFDAPQKKAAVIVLITQIVRRHELFSQRKRSAWNVLPMKNERVSISVKHPTVLCSLKFLSISFLFVEWRETGWDRQEWTTRKTVRKTKSCLSPNGSHDRWTFRTEFSHYSRDERRRYQNYIEPCSGETSSSPSLIKRVCENYHLAWYWSLLEIFKRHSKRKLSWESFWVLQIYSM